MILPALLPWQWGVGALCGFLVGVAKTGVPGIGIMVVPLMALLVGSAKQSAGWLLPLLCAADVFAVFYYRRHAHTRRLVTLVPWVFFGMGIGALALALPDVVLRRIVGVIVLSMVVVQRVRSKVRTTDTGHRPTAGRWQPIIFGSAAGFSTTVANAAGPVMNAYLLTQRLAKDEFIGTGAWFFLVINVLKLPLLGFHGLITMGSLSFDLLVLPALVSGAVLGRLIFKHIPQKLFETLVFSLTVAATVPLLLRL